MDAGFWTLSCRNGTTGLGGCIPGVTCSQQRSTCNRENLRRNMKSFEMLVYRLLKIEPCKIQNSEIIILYPPLAFALMVEAKKPS